MVIKKLILLLVILAVLVFGYLNWWGGNQEQGEEAPGGSGDSGGTSGGTQPPTVVQTPEEAITSEEMETPAETETFEEEETPQEAETAEEGGTPEETLTPGIEEGIEEEQTENVTGEEEEPGIVQPAETEPEIYLVRLKNYLFIPSELEVNSGDTVVWRNFDESGVFTLRSKEGLFEDQQLGYGNTLNYTFTENGSYSFSANGYPNMQMTITVK
ncbi:cell surface lipoprotein [Methanosarcina sp. T3]|uniref:cell surface lipoprotein n=1 Tax=Methanosarcina sp. T3 TaxID=3439062 RepID=UPI003F82831F